MIQSVKVTNHVNESLLIDLKNPEASGFVIRSIDGLGPGKASLSTIDRATMDGAVFSSARVPARNIIFTLTFAGNTSAETLRNKSYRYFPLKKTIKLNFITDERTCEISGVVESNEPNIFSQEESLSISVMCPVPFFTVGEAYRQVTYLSGVSPEFEFPFENDSLIDNQLTMGTIGKLMQNIITYNGDVDTGVVIKIHAVGEAENVTFYNLGTREQFKINTAMLEKVTGSKIKAGDDITISTVKGAKYVHLLRNGEISNILNCVDKGVSWFQITNGDNRFAYTADFGDTNLQIRIENQVYYEGL